MCCRHCVQAQGANDSDHDSKRIHPDFKAAAFAAAKDIIIIVILPAIFKLQRWSLKPLPTSRPRGGVFEKRLSITVIAVTGVFRAFVLEPTSQKSPEGDAWTRGFRSFAD
jgi:hypothetical protein